MRTYIPDIKTYDKYSKQCGFSNVISQWIEGKDEKTQFHKGIYYKVKMTLWHQR